MSTNYNEEYKNYNKATVTIFTSGNSYVISNILKEGQPGKDCSCHIQSVTINSPVYGVNNPEMAGSNGEITIIDYADSVFNKLINHMNQFLDNNSIVKDGTDPVQLCPTVTIEIECYTNNFKIDKAYIVDWKMQFSGTTPSIVLSFTCIPPTTPLQATSPLGDQNAKWEPFAAIEECNKIYGNLAKIVVVDDEDSADRVKDCIKSKISSDSMYLITFAPYYRNPKTRYFPNIPFRINASTSSNSNVPLLVATWIASNAKYLPSDLTNLERPLTADELKRLRRLTVHYDDENKVVVININSNSKNHKRRSACDGLIFSQNLNCPAYSKVTVGKSEFRNIPMSQFSFDTSLTKCVLQTSVRDQQGGSKVDTDKESKNANAEPEAVDAIVKSNAANQENQPITISFDCYNVMSFKCNDLESSILFIVYNELGESHTLCKNNKAAAALVRKCIYTLEGAVVKAHIEATMAFNSVINNNNLENSTVKIHKQTVEKAEPDVVKQDEQEQEKEPEVEETPKITIIRSMYRGTGGQKFEKHPKWIVVHYTAYDGYSAPKMCKEMVGKGQSSHFYVDSNSIYSSVPLENRAFHVRSGQTVQPDMAGDNKYSKFSEEIRRVAKEYVKQQLGVAYSTTSKTIIDQMVEARVKEINKSTGSRGLRAEIWGNAVKSGKFKEYSQKELAEFPVEYKYRNVNKGPRYWRVELAAKNHLKWAAKNDDFAYGGKDYFSRVSGGNNISYSADFCCVCDTDDKNRKEAEDGNWKINPKAVENMAKLVAYLATKDRKDGIEIDLDHIIRHGDATGKLCPAPFIWPPEEGDKKWAEFKAKVAGYIKTGVDADWVNENDLNKKK